MRGGSQAYHDLTQSSTPFVQYGSHSQTLFLGETFGPQPNIPMQSVYAANTVPYPYGDITSASQEGPKGFFQGTCYVEGFWASDPSDSGAPPDTQSAYGKVPIARTDTVACPHCERSFQSSRQLR
jgi:hypothetical protein